MIERSAIGKLVYFYTERPRRFWWPFPRREKYVGSGVLVEFHADNQGQYATFQDRQSVLAKVAWNEATKR